MKVYIFIDGQNFYRALQRYDETLRVDYDRLAAWITQAVGGPSAFFGGAYYYVGVSPDAPPQVEGFLKGRDLACFDVRPERFKPGCSHQDSRNSFQSRGGMQLVIEFQTVDARESIIHNK